MKERLDRLGAFLVSAFKLTAMVGIYFKTERLPVLFLLYSELEVRHREGRSHQSALSPPLRVR